MWLDEIGCFLTMLGSCLIMLCIGYFRRFNNSAPFIRPRPQKASDTHFQSPSPFTSMPTIRRTRIRRCSSCAEKSVKGLAWIMKANDDWADIHCDPLTPRSAHSFTNLKVDLAQEFDFSKRVKLWRLRLHLLPLPLPIAQSPRGEIEEQIDRQTVIIRQNRHAHSPSTPRETSKCVRVRSRKVTYFGGQSN